MNAPEVSPPPTPSPLVPVSAPGRRWRSRTVPLLLIGGSTVGVVGLAYALIRPDPAPVSAPVAAADWGDDQASPSPSPASETRGSGYHGGWWWFHSFGGGGASSGYRSGGTGGGASADGGGTTSRGGFGGSGHASGSSSGSGGGGHASGGS